MRKLMTLNGHATNANDPQRAVLFSQECGYWTDDFSKPRQRHTRIVRITGLVKCCPHCLSVLSEVTYTEWQANTDEMEQSKPGSASKVAAMKERCSKQMTRFLKDET